MVLLWLLKAAVICHITSDPLKSLEHQGTWQILKQQKTPRACWHSRSEKTELARLHGCIFWNPIFQLMEKHHELPNFAAVVTHTSGSLGGGKFIQWPHSLEIIVLGCPLLLHNKPCGGEGLFHAYSQPFLTYVIKCLVPAEFMALP